ncbi:hypothetical protein [Nocardioides daejeonensis]|uniref:hypothetical protein n=1 Tax=Nocardioides daejeonensis TaxID=1046556 RepID=UPI000D74C847|nr:hypothetical protein [Nocardioides daejeonensis]
MSRIRRLLGSTAAVLLTAAVGAVLPGSFGHPAAAAACTGNTGVTVVVDYGDKGGIQAGCASGAGGGTASTAFTQAGFAISYVDRGPGVGMVCRVAGVPADASCTSAPPADAYWSLWYAGPTSGTWTYATRGVTQLRVPEGSYVAFAWHEGSGNAKPPGVTPKRSTPAPQPTKKPTPKPTKSASQQPAKPSTTAPSAAESTATPTESTTSAEPTESSSEESASGEPSGSAAPSDDTSSDVPTVDEITDGPPEGGTVDGADGGDDGLPLWIPIVAVVLVGAAGGAVAVRRRAG